MDDSKSINVCIVTDHQTAVMVARTLWEIFLAHYGWPEILTDESKSFENNLI